MKRITAPQAPGITILLSGGSAKAPLGMKPMTGVLVWCDGPNLACWHPGELEWLPLNAAGWASRFGTNMPILPNGTWAVITSPVLAAAGNVCHHQIGPISLRWAFHAVTAVVPMPTETVPGESGGQAKSHTSESDPEQGELAQDIADYVAECATQGADPLK